MREKMTQRRPWILWKWGACLLAGSFVVGTASWSGASRKAERPRRFGRRFFTALVVSLLGTAGLFAVQSGSAGAAITNWSVVPSPNLTGVTPLTIGGLNDVSCLSATDCMAVGDETTSTGTHTLAESWDGTSWSIVSTPDQGSYGSFLNGISCTSASNCTAVGTYLLNAAGSMQATLVETWDGTSWSIVSSPNAGTQQQALLLHVSCTSATDCTAVGWYQTLATVVIPQTLVEQWDGTSWSVVSSPDPNDADVLLDVSCSSASACVAVGVTYIAGNEQTLVESWDGTSWSVVSSPSPNPFDVLNGVACTSATNCFAVGSSAALAGTETLVESWDGTSWSVVSSPNQGTLGSDLQSVSCVSSTFCQAAGAYDSSTNTGATLVESWDGTSWSIASTPNTEVSDALARISCVDTSHCTAVGSAQDSTPVYSTLVLSGVDGDLALVGVPSNITVNATGPSGANVTFFVPTASDEETPPTVSCDHGSGLYPIGTTTVSCSATDADDSPSSVTGSFTITVQGAATQLASLLTYVTGLGSGMALQNQVQSAINDVSANNSAAACTQLDSLISLAKAQSGKKLTLAQATQIIAAATQIEAILGC
jgi:hypothetical protein